MALFDKYQKGGIKTVIADQIGSHKQSNLAIYHQEKQQLLKLPGLR